MMQLRRNMRADDPDWAYLNRAYDRIADLATSNIEAIREMESHVEMMGRMMKVIETTDINVMDVAHRYLVKEGVLQCPRYARMSSLCGNISTSKCVHVLHNIYLGTA
jgi:hypothetical protein